MEKILKAITLFLISGTVVIALICYFNVDLYRTLIKEDGPIETLTALTLLISSVLLLLRLIKVGRSKKPMWIIINVFLIGGLFFGFGEEISWGQRIFSLESSDFFVEKNLQKEINLHNLKLGGVELNRVLFTYVLGLVFGFYFLFSLLLFRKNNLFKNLISKLGIPIPKIHHTIIFFLATLIITTIPDTKKWELWECLFVLTLFMVFLQPYNVSEKLLLTKIKND
jgi:hypothetical protein